MCIFLPVLSEVGSMAADFSTPPPDRPTFPELAAASVVLLADIAGTLRRLDAAAGAAGSLVIHADAIQNSLITRSRVIPDKTAMGIEFRSRLRWMKASFSDLVSCLGTTLKLIRLSPDDLQAQI